MSWYLHPCLGFPNILKKNLASVSSQHFSGHTVFSIASLEKYINFIWEESHTIEGDTGCQGHGVAEIKGVLGNWDLRPTGYKHLCSSQSHKWSVRGTTGKGDSVCSPETALLNRKTLRHKHQKRGP